MRHERTYTTVDIPRVRTKTEAEEIMLAGGYVQLVTENKLFIYDVDGENCSWLIKAGHDYFNTLWEDGLLSEDYQLTGYRPEYRIPGESEERVAGLVYRLTVGEDGIDIDMIQ